MEIREVSNPDPTLKLDPGEQEAIVLAERSKADAVLLDERGGREAARQRGLVVIVTLGVLKAAAGQGLIDLPSVIARLRQTSFRAHPILFDRLLERAARRKRE